MVKVNSLGVKGVEYMKEIFWIIKFVEKGYLFLKIKGNMKEVGKIIKWMDMENLNGQMGENMKEIIKMIKKKGMELLVGLTEGNIEGIGKMEDKMEKGSFIILKIKNGKKEYGKKEKEQNGLIDIKIFF